MSLDVIVTKLLVCAVMGTREDSSLVVPIGDAGDSSHHARPDRRSAMLILRAPAPLWCVLTMGVLVIIFAALFFGDSSSTTTISSSTLADLPREEETDSINLKELLLENSKLKIENSKLKLEVEKLVKVFRSPGLFNISWDPFSNSAGPVPQIHRPNSSVAVFFVGERGRRKLKDMLPRFPPSSFLYIFLIYDNSLWNDEANLYPGIWIHAKGQLKWWFVKRFVPPAISALYDFVWIVEEDAQFSFEQEGREVDEGKGREPEAAEAEAEAEEKRRRNKSFSSSLALDYNTLAMQQRWDLSKPASVDTGREVVRPAKAAGQLGVRYTDFLELDPILVVSSRAWPCFWSVLLGESSTGWGLDLIMCNYLTQRCATSLPSMFDTRTGNDTTIGSTGCVVVDSFEVRRDGSLPPRKLQEEGWKEASLYKNVYQGLEAQVRVHDPPATNQP